MEQVWWDWLCVVCPLLPPTASLTVTHKSSHYCHTMFTSTSMVWEINMCLQCGICVIVITHLAGFKCVHDNELMRSF